MVSFMVLGGQRSATTWMANLLTTDTTICIHDPLHSYTIEELDKLSIPGKRIGISCTGSLLFADWMRKHPAKKILLFREPDEINTSLRALGLPEMEVARQWKLLEDLNMPTFQWDQMFISAVAEEACKILNVPFCPYRHYELRRMNVQPAWQRLDVNPEAVRVFVQRLKEVM